MSNKFLGTVGEHRLVELFDSKDVNGRFMVKCNTCETVAHAYSEDQAIMDLNNCRCNPHCRNCNNLRRSGTKRPAAPIDGEYTDRLHICPKDGNRWWQSNGRFHHWQQITSAQEWESLTGE